MQDDSVITETPTDMLAAIDELLDPAPIPAAEEGSQIEPVVEEDDGAAKEAHKEEMRELYAREITLQDGEKTTIGALKDAFQTRAASEADIIERENRMLVQTRALNELAETLNTVPEHIRQAAVAQRENFVKAEFQNLLTAIPEWKDAVAFDSGRKAVFALAAEYGLEQDMGAVVDHRVVKLLHDYARLKANIRQAKETLVPKVEASAPTGRKPIPTPRTNNRPQGMTAQLAAIDALIA